MLNVKKPIHFLFGDALTTVAKENNLFVVKTQPEITSQLFRFKPKEFANGIDSFSVFLLEKKAQKKYKALCKVDFSYTSNGEEKTPSVKIEIFGEDELLISRMKKIFESKALEDIIPSNEYKCSVIREKQKEYGTII